ncbi:MAG: hypothetical protein ABIV06_04270 [Thermoanaerobaculia bacterium]
MRKILVLLPLLICMSAASEAAVATEGAFSTDPGDCIITIFSQGGEATERYLYRIFGDGRVEGNRYNGRSQVPARTWTANVDPAELASIQGDILRSGLVSFNEERQQQAIASTERKPHVETDAVTTLLTFTLTTEETRPSGPTHQVLLGGGSAAALDYPEVPEYAAAGRLLKLLGAVREPLLETGVAP